MSNAMFGFTNDKRIFNQVCKWRNAAVADGWTKTARYLGHESIDRACKLVKNGYHASILTREKSGNCLFEATIHIWGPDDLAIDCPEVYDWNKIVAGTKVCSNCHTENVDTVRFSFAGRCCKKCLPEMQRLYEKRGWSD